ncbi:MAG: hypothetical protein IJR54_06060 [Oscillibacter sp.]|nr:hypothetical protein [Oscillibacter sp.]
MLFSNGETHSLKASGAGGGMPGGVAYHTASFDYAYRCVAVMERLLRQS